MRIKAKCRTHPEAVVYMLEETTSTDADNVEIYLDEANCYCTSEEKDHDIYFETEEGWRRDAD